jgi:hypothetical protein
MFHKPFLLRATRRLIVGMLVCLLVGYVSVYVTLRNKSLREMREFGSEGFLYDDAQTIFRTHDMSTHNVRRVLFWPANYVDRKLFNGPDPVICFLFDLS